MEMSEKAGFLMTQTKRNNDGPTAFDRRVQKVATEVFKAREAAQEEARQRREAAESRQKSRRRFLSPA
jgi:hypothetical protein